MRITKKEEIFPLYENVEIREPKVSDIINAQRTSDKNEGAEYEAALIAEIATFDGKRLVYEDILNLPMDFFFQLKDVMMGGALTELVKQLLSSQTEADSAPKQS